LRFYGPDSRAPYQKAPAKLHINDPLPLVPATRTTTDGSSTSSSSSSSNQNQHAHLQWTALHEAAAMRDLNKAVALLEQGVSKEGMTVALLVHFYISLLTFVGVFMGGHTCPRVWHFL